MVENRQIGGVLTFFETLGAKSTVNTDVFRALEAQNHGIYDVFASGNQNHGIYSVFWPVPSKNSYLRSFQHVARSTFSMPKAQKHCNYTVNYNVSGLLFGFVEGRRGGVLQ